MSQNNSSVVDSSWTWLPSLSAGIKWSYRIRMLTGSLEATALRDPCVQPWGCCCAASSAGGLCRLSEGLQWMSNNHPEGSLGCSFSRLVAAACCAFPISQEAVGEKTWRQLHRLREILIQKFFLVNRLGVFMGLGGLSCIRNISGWFFWNWRSLHVAIG